MAEDNIYAAPESNLAVEKDRPAFFFATSHKKLLILYFATLGAYTIYWFYKHWQEQKIRNDEPVIPVLRAIFYIFFTYPLFKRIAQAAKEKNIPIAWGAGWLSTVFIIMTLISNGFDRVTARSTMIGVLDYVSILIIVPLVFPLYWVQNTANYVNGDKEGKSNSRFSVYNYLFIGLGVLLWIAVAIELGLIDIDALVNTL